jgi:hypothetical protein
VTVPITATKTIVQIFAVANHRVLIKRIDIGFKGISATDVPFTVEGLVQTGAGTSVDLPLVKKDSDAGETLLTTARQTVTAEPTAGNITHAWIFHPQTARTIILPPDEPIIINGGDRFGIRVLSPAQAGTINVCVHGVE